MKVTLKKWNTVVTEKRKRKMAERKKKAKEIITDDHESPVLWTMERAFFLVSSPWK